MIVKDTTKQINKIMKDLPKDVVTALKVMERMTRYRRHQYPPRLVWNRMDEDCR